MKREIKSNIKYILLFAICIFVITYIVYEARFVINGPELTIFTPTNNSTAASPVLNITGKAKNISMLTVNGRPIMITPDNLFTDKLLLLPGYNRIEIKAQNKFNQQKSEILNIVLREPKTSFRATSSPPENISTSTKNSNN